MGECNKRNLTWRARVTNILCAFAIPKLLVVAIIRSRATAEVTIARLAGERAIVVVDVWQRARERECDWRQQQDCVWWALFASECP